MKKEFMLVTLCLFGVFSGLHAEEEKKEVAQETTAPASTEVAKTDASKTDCGCKN